MTAIQSRPDQRLEWLDCAKGIGIILVVAGHALGGLIDSDLDLKAFPARIAFTAIYTFHMALFFFLAGYLVSGRVERNQKKFAEAVALNIIYPYFLWSIIQFTIINAAGSLVNTPADNYLHTIFSLPIRPISQFWFLYSLAAFHIISMLSLKLSGSTGLFVASLVLWPVSFFNEVPDIVKQSAEFFPFYAAGVLIGDGRLGETSPNSSSPGRAIALLLAAAAAITLFITLGPARDAILSTNSADGVKSTDLAQLAGSPYALAAAVLGMAAIIQLADVVSGKSQWLLSYLGRRSMPIFILHILFVAGTRIIAQKVLNFPDVYVIFPAILCAGLLGPIVIAEASLRLRIAKILGLA